MPVTPLHFGVLAPVNHFAPGKVSNPAFIAVNILLDLTAITEVISGVPQGPWHPPETHSFLGSCISALIVIALAILWSKRKKAHIYGAFLGAWSHVILDMLWRPEMQPFYPLLPGNPFYTGRMDLVNQAMMVLLAWWMFQGTRFYRVKVR